jgi:hypothetical protein
MRPPRSVTPSSRISLDTHNHEGVRITKMQTPRTMN